MIESAIPSSRTHNQRVRPTDRAANTHQSSYGRGASARRASTYPTTVYRLDGVMSDVAGLRAGLNRRYLEQQHFAISRAEISGAEALLIHGQVSQPKAGWCPVIADLTGQVVDIGHSSDGCALLIAVDEQVYALTYGAIGRFMINVNRIGPCFGIEFAIRAVRPDRIRQLTRRVLASTGRVDRNLVPGGQPIHRYAVEGWGEIVGQLTGNLTNERLTVTRGSTRPVSIVGADSLKIALSTDPAGLLADLREIARVCTSDPPVPELDFIAQIRPLRTGERTAELDRRLDELLGEGDPSDVGLAVPITELEYEPFAHAYRVKVPHQRGSCSPELELGALLACVRSRPPGRRLAALQHGQIGMCADVIGAEPLAPALPAHKWITAEVASGSARMIYHEGRWYEIGARHLDLLRAEIEKILGNPSMVVLPPWSSDLANEDAYNRHVAASDAGYVLLDKHLLKTRQHNRGPGIEACDLLGPDDELIHVKRADRSAPLSHLFTQAEVAVDSLLYEPDARERLAAMVHSEAPNRRIDATFKPRKVVYAIALESGKPLTAATLFTFAQVALYRAVRRLRAEEIDVEVVAIPR